VLKCVATYQKRVILTTEIDWYLIAII